MLLEPIFGSKNREYVLAFIWARGEGYARQISRFFATDLSPVQAQLDRLAAAGILVSKEVGRTILFEFNPRYPLRDPLGELMDKAIAYYPEELRERLLMNRRRPRRRGKPG